MIKYSHIMNFDEIYKKVKSEAKSFGIKPINDVGKILNIVQSAELPEREVMDMTKKIYIQLYQAYTGGDLNQARQSWVNASGNNFESFIRNVVNEALNKEGILAVKGDELQNNPDAQEIVRFLTLGARRRCTQSTTGVWPDSDIVVLTKEKGGRLKAFALLNCKTSDHSRNDAVLFWALAMRDNNIKYCLVTQDLDKRFVKGDNDASSLRKKAEAYLDRVYSTHPDTNECSQVMKLDFTRTDGGEPLFSDLKIWRREVVPDFTNNPINLQLS